ncbi:MAG: sigma-54-dependent Fis family transcriptional regulator [Deltaproteobacteria bacterium]|nr:sigma-54-dependent Fis family transcriptional regulator [Deltaproteobacteria bacterium]
MVSYKDHLQLLRNIALEIAAAETPREVIEVVLDTFEKTLRFNNAAVIFFDESMTNLNVFRTRGMSERVHRFVMEKIPAFTKEFLQLIEKNHLQPVIWDDVAVEKDVFYDTGIFKTLFWLPVIVHKRPIGIMGFAWEKPNSFDRDYLETCSILGNLLGGELQKLQHSLRTIRDQEQRISALEEELQKRAYVESAAARVIGGDPKMKAIYGTVMAIADTDVNVLIEGETGTGKEMIADDIHYLSHRKQGPLVKVNCGALSETLLESELFGHVKGAFTGAYRDRLGRFEMARGGTLFLDEIGEMSLNMQVKLLRVLQGGAFERLGDSRPLQADARILCATNKDLRGAVSVGTFRKDLYYRLNVISIAVPPLRERMGDIPLFLNFFIDKYNRRYGMDVKGVSRKVIDKCYAFNWTGNVRELENVIERAVVTYKTGVIDDIDIAAEGFGEKPGFDPTRGGENFFESRRRVVADFEKEYLASILRKNRGSIVKSAREAGLNRKNFYLKMKKYSLSRQHLEKGS